MAWSAAYQTACFYLPPAGSLQKPAVRLWTWMSVWSRRTSLSTRRRWEPTTGTCWWSCLASWMNRSHYALTNQSPDCCHHSTAYCLIQLHGIMIILFLVLCFVMHTAAFMHICFCFPVSFTPSYSLNFSFHCSYMKVFLLSATSLSNSSLSTLSKASKYVMSSMFLVNGIMSQSSLAFPGPKPHTLHPSEIPWSNVIFLFFLLSRFFTQNKPERNGTAPTE